MIDQNDLLNEVSLNELTQLTDLEGTGELDARVLDDAIIDALAFIGSFIEIPANPTRLLRQIAVELTVAELRRRNKLKPSKEWEERKKELERYLRQMASGRIPTALSQSQTPKTKPHAFFHGGYKIDTKGFV